MDKIENFLKEPSMEKLEKLRKSEIIKIGEKLELNVQNSMRKHELVREIASHMVDENVFEEAVLEELPTEMIRMTPEEIELEKIKIQAQMELQRNKMELEKIKIQQETRLREVVLANKRTQRKPWQFRSSEASEASPKIWRSQRGRILRTFWANCAKSWMAERMLVDATPNCADRKSTESICNSAHRKLRRLWFGESSGILKASNWFQKLIDRNSEHREKLKTSLMWNFWEKKRMHWISGVTLRG